LTMMLLSPPHQIEMDGASAAALLRCVL